MSRRKAAYRRQKQNKVSMFLVSVVVLMIMVVVLVGSNDLREKISIKTAEEQAVDEQIAAEESRAAEIDNLEKEVQTKGYYENVAREKLGLVYEDEIVFKED